MSRSSARSRTTIRSFAVSFLALLCLGLVAPPAGGATGDVTEFTIPTPVSLPQGIVVGPDGVSWFAQRSANAIGSLSNGTFSQYPLPNAGSAPFWVTLGSDGNVWFTERSGNRIGKVTSTGEITEYPIPTAGSQPGEITNGPDGALWFTEQSGNRIGRITTLGEITEFVLPRASSGPLGITSGPDGALWFTEVGTSGNRIGRITTAGQVTEFPLVFSNRQPTDITVGSDGNLWFTERAGNAVGRITPGGSIDEFILPSSLPNPVGIAAGPDGNIWFAELGSNNIGRIAPDGTITEFPLPNPNSQPFGIALGIDGAMWFTEAAGNRIGRIEVLVAPPPDLTPPSVTITTPSDRAVYVAGQAVFADYACADEAGGSGLATCDGPVIDGDPIDTSLGTHTFTVNATDVAGNPAEASTTYLVSASPDLTPPSVTITSPSDGAAYAVGQVVLADYACADDAGGSGLATCDGPVIDGDPIDTSPGIHTFTVNATDVAGNAGGATATYLVLGDLGGSMLPAPAWNDATAGSSLTVSFDLRTLISALRTHGRPHHGRHGGHGHGVPSALLAPGYPMTQQVDCDDPTRSIGPSMMANVDINVSRDGHFHLVWKSEKRWAGTCRALVLSFDEPGWSDAHLTFFVRFH